MREKLSALFLGLILFAGVQRSSAAIINGGFETGDFTGWTVDPDPSFPQYIVPTDDPLGPVNSGSFAAQIAGFSFEPNTLSQTVMTTAGQLYELSFARYQDPGGPVVSLDVTWNGDTVFSELEPLIRGVYQTFTVSVVGTGSDELVFISAHDPAFTYLDEVSLTVVGAAVPEPATLTLWGLGALGCAIGAYRRRRAV